MPGEVLLPAAARAVPSAGSCLARLAPALAAAQNPLGVSTCVTELQLVGIVPKTSNTGSFIRWNSSLVRSGCEHSSWHIAVFVLLLSEFNLKHFLQSKHTPVAFTHRGVFFAFKYLPGMSQNLLSPPPVIFSIPFPPDNHQTACKFSLAESARLSCKLAAAPNFQEYIAAVATVLPTPPCFAKAG